MDTTILYDNDYKGGAAESGISGFWLKMIAVITMLIDHIAASIIERMLLAGMLGKSGDIVYYAMRGIGRLAFPIYVFLLVEGFTYTKSKVKYGARLFVFALLSEIPFDLAFNNCVFEIQSNNVFITLFLGFVTICALEIIKRHPRYLDASKSPVAWIVVHSLRCIGMAAVILGMMVIAEIGVKCDYGAAGIATIVAMYLLKNFRKCGFVVVVVLLALLCDFWELCALFMLVPIHFYNGTRGKQMKYFFYAFYPVHLLIIALIGYLMGLGI